jgi:cob(I)alamin adenosyltransferase
MDETADADDRKVLIRIQSNLFSLGGYLADERANVSCRILPEEVEELEKELDKIEEIVPPFKHFVLPGGCRSNSLAHVCRTVCRRAERCIYQLNEDETIDPVALKYINRLSDFFFLFARKQSIINKINENSWENTCK